MVGQQLRAKEIDSENAIAAVDVRLALRREETKWLLRPTLQKTNETEIGERQ